MLTIAAFASLAQLGSGLALALAIFVEPITTRDRQFRQKLEGSLKLLLRDGSENSAIKENEIWVGIANLNTTTKTAHSRARWPLLVIKFGAAINFVILLAATVCPDAEVDNYYMWILLASCVLPVVGGYTLLLMIARIVTPQPRP